jgi:hypothetical protein
MMKGLILSAVAAASVAATLNAQVVTGKPDSTCTNFPNGRVECKVLRGSAKGDSAFHNKIFYRMDSAMAKRAALGLELRATGTRRDTLGVFVEAVTPKGPAETAGIIEGDRIAAINGVDLRTASGDIEDSYINGLAAHRLTREVQKLTPGSRVTLRVYSGGRLRDVQVTAAKASDVMRLGGRFNYGMPYWMPGSARMMEFNGPGGAMMFGPDMPMLRHQIEPQVRERLNNPPNKVQLRTPMRFKTLAPVRIGIPRVFKVEAGHEGELVPARRAQILSPDGDVFIDTGDLTDYEEGMVLDLDDELFDIENEIEQVPPDLIRDLAATAIRDAQSALKQLAAAGVV